MEASANRKFDVGGVMLDRPFRISRLGHFGYFTNHMKESLHFYLDLLGFQMSDPLDFARRVPPEHKGKFETVGYFTRFNSDHHSFVIFPRRFFEVVTGLQPQHTVNQITWQVGSLKQVVDAAGWMQSREIEIDRSGRDMPGSNWHTYMRDPEGSRNELYYGMEQIGWIGRSKPLPMHNRRFTQVADLPQIPEWKEVDDAVAAGVDLLSGVRNEEKGPLDYQVGGILMPRPFKITSIGPVQLMVDNMLKAVDFYTSTMGFDITEEVTWRGHRCLFLRCNTDHHCLSLYPRAIAQELELPHQSLCFSFGMRLYDYQQLRDAVAFLKKNGVRIIHLPPELFPGMDYTAFAVDPDGHLIQLYCYMEQIGWDGKPKPAHLRRKVDNNAWPETVQALSDSFNGEPFLGPWA
jgi:catechol 2,3-dioxygenase-like lactoylglutathione lyase family enzyme